MVKPEHRQVSIAPQLATVRDIARQLRSHEADSSVRYEIAGLLGSKNGPTPFVELFNWAHIQATADSSREPLRDTLYELIRICGRIGRHCKLITDYPDESIDSFDRVAIADRLETLAMKLAKESR